MVFAIVLYENFGRRGRSRPSDLIVWHAPSVLMNPNLKKEHLYWEQRLDSSCLARECEREFAEDVDALLAEACVDGAIMRGRHELSVTYVAAADPTGMGADAFTPGIAQRKP